MMLIPAIIVTAFFLGCFCTVAYLVYFAPEATEDEAGFRPVPPAALDEGDFDVDGHDLKSVYDGSGRLADRDGLAPAFPFHDHTTSAREGAKHA